MNLYSMRLARFKRTANQASTLKRCIVSKGARSRYSYHKCGITLRYNANKNCLSYLCFA
jgi:hypothetical protein